MPPQNIRSRFDNSVNEHQRPNQKQQQQQHLFNNIRSANVVSSFRHSAGREAQLILDSVNKRTLACAYVTKKLNFRSKNLKRRRKILNKNGQQQSSYRNELNINIIFLYWHVNWNGVLIEPTVNGIINVRFALYPVDTFW